MWAYPLEFTDYTSWELLVRRAEWRDSSELGFPISLFESPSPFLLIGARSQTARPTWRLGCYAGLFTWAVPGLSTNYNKTFLGNIPVLLNKLGYANFLPIPLGSNPNPDDPDAEPTPYKYMVEIQIPKYHHHLEYEIWWYNGDVKTLQ